jgi:hypothetical protein
MKRILITAGVIAALHTPAHADGWWVLMTDTTTDPMQYFCQSEAPAEGFASLVRRGFVPRYIDKGTTGDGEAIVEVAYMALTGQETVYSYYHGLNACQLTAKLENEGANKYR